MPGEVLKRCTKCGVAREYGPRVRRCHATETRFGKQYYCWGRLERVVTKRERPPKAEGTLSSTARGAQVRARAQQDLDRVRKRIADHTRTLTATVAYISKYSKKITKLETRAAQLARRASMTDDEIEAERQRTIATLRKRSKATRHIEVEE